MTCNRHGGEGHGGYNGQKTRGAVTCNGHGGDGQAVGMNSQGIQYLIGYF